MAEGGFRLAADIGGTFTDVVLERDADGVRFSTKVLTTYHDPADGVMQGIDRVLAESRLPAQAARLMLHGTTLATNALIQRSGAKTALLTTEGHRDAVEMALENRFEQYDINIDRPTPLVPRQLRLPVRERMGAQGQVLAPLDMDSVDAAIAELATAEVESVAIGFLHGYADPAHEQQVAERLTAAREQIPPGLNPSLGPIATGLGERFFAIHHSCAGYIAQLFYRTCCDSHYVNLQNLF